jgi:hypothetical protein
MSYKLLNKFLFIVFLQSVLHQKVFCFIRHSGLDPESSVSEGGDI